MGLLKPQDWSARLIGAPESDTVPNVEGVFASSPAPLFRHEFELHHPPARARVYASALGLYELWVNGSRVGNRALAPGWTDYHTRIQYQTYDVTPILVHGTNALGAVLGHGWYWGHVATRAQVYGHTPALFAQLEVSTRDGEILRVASEATWRTAPGGITFDDLLMGEEEDAAAWPEEWTRPGFDDRPWPGASYRAPTGGRLVAQVDTGVTCVEVVCPVGVTWHEGTSIMDMGQNVAGRVRTDLDVPPGTAVTLRHGEMLCPDGALYTDGLESARQTDRFVARGGGERFEPRFRYHGFRFVEVSGLSDPIEPDQMAACVLSEDLDRTGDFSCSDPMLNQLQRNIVRSLRANFISVPTDCPQRDERLGWTGDAQVIAPTAASNLDVLPVFRKWLIDLEDAQLPSGANPDVAPGAIYGDAGNAGWGDAGILLPWTLFVRYGAADVLERHYDGMRRHLEYLRASSTEHVRRAARYGDWLGLEGITPKAAIATAYFAYCARGLSYIAQVLDDERGRFEKELYGSIRSAFIERYVEDDGGIAERTQVGCVLALHGDLVPDDLREATAAKLAAGFLGTPLALPVLSESGYRELACRVAQQRTFPSWGFQIEQGATTLWERWDGWTPEWGFHEIAGGNSVNHYAFGVIGDWLYRYVGGLDPHPAHAEYGHARIHPRPGGSLTEASVWHASPHGRWEVEWKLDGDELTLDATVPANATAEIVLPAQRAEVRSPDYAWPPPEAKVVERAGSTHVLAGSGTYRFRAPAPLTSSDRTTPSAAPS